MNKFNIDFDSVTFKKQHVKHPDFTKSSLSKPIHNFTKSLDKSALLHGNFVEKDIPALNISKGLALMMEDTACTSNTMDTFYINSFPNIDSYNWILPTGANIVTSIGDTMIVVDWTNSIIGLQEICIETINDCGKSSPTCFPIQVSICNFSPNAVADRDTTPANINILVNVQVNDTDPDNGTLTTSLYPAENPNNGTVSLIGNNIVYSPATNFTGTDNFEYIICDDGDPVLCDTAQVTIVVENTAPIAVNDQAFATVGTTIKIPVQNNDSDPENHDLTTSLNPLQGPSQGIVSLKGDTIQYTSNQDAIISDQFSYIICDNDSPILCDTAIVTILIGNQKPIAVADIDTTLSNEFLIINVQNNDNDPENGDLTTSFIPSNSPDNGTLSLNGDDIQYTPNTNFIGTDMFGYIICDSGSPSLCDTANVTIVVLNRKPNAEDDSTSTLSDVPVNITVQNNDTDPENGDLTTTLEPNNGPSNGSVSLNGDEIIYTPSTGFSGSDEFDYIICDDGIPSLCDTATVTINTINQAPIAVQDSETTSLETPIIIDVQDNDSDSENGTLTTTINPSFLPDNGTIAVLNNDSILYTPNQGFNGTDEFEYIICDSGTPSLCDTATVTINVPNSPPIAVDDINNTLVDTPVEGQVLINDYDINGDDLIINPVLISSTANGSINFNPNGTYTYTPFIGFIGEDVFEYEICDVNINSFCDTGKVVIEVINKSLNENRPPIANPDNYLSEENITLNSNLLSNDVEPDDDNIILNTAPIVTPTNGSVTIFPNGDFQYTPNSDFLGEDNFVYNICDNGSPFLCDTTTVTIKIIPNLGNNIFAVDDAIIGDVNTVFIGNVEGNDFDPEGHPITTNRSPVSPVKNGVLVLNSNGTFNYTPSSDYSGTDQFQYEICDNQSPSSCDTATVYITVLESNQPPIAINNNNLTQEGVATTGNVLDNDFDLESDNIILNTSPLNIPVNGNVILNTDGTYTYTPNSNFIGTDYYTYEICDDGIPSLCDTAKVTIEVIGKLLLVNDKPIATNDNFVTAINTQLNKNIIDNDSDPDGNDININTTTVSSPTNGVVNIRPNGTYIYTPNTDYIGQDSFQYSICDNGSPSLCDTAEVNITIISIDPDKNWTFANEDTYITHEDITTNGDLLANDSDPEGDLQTIEIFPITYPINGTLSIYINGTFNYVPDANYVGNDQFDYKVCDNKVPSACDTTTVYLTMLSVNDAPIAVDDTNITNEDTPTNGTVLINDSDPENTTITVNTTPVDDVDNGILDLNINGTYTYIPDHNFIGSDTLLYEICDNGDPVLCDTAKIIITVVPINDAPIAQDDTYSTPEDTPISENLADNDSDHDGDELILNPIPVNAPTNGILTLNPDSTFTYTPLPSFNGQDTFRYEICDNYIPKHCDTAEVIVTILPINDAPFAINDVNIIPIDGKAIGNLVANDFDIENDKIFINTNPINQPPNGMVSFNPDGTYIYMPNSGYVGEDIFLYEVCDNGTPILCDTATVIIEILEKDPLNNNPPIGINDVFITLINTPVMNNIISNDFDLDEDEISVIPNPVTSPQNGSVTINSDGTFKYTPSNNFTGDDEFIYRICDDQNPSLCTDAKVTVTVVPFIEGLNLTFANDDVANTLEDTPVSGDLLANDTDPEGHIQTINPTPTDLPNNGVVVINLNGTYTYTPATDYAGTDQFKYIVCDNGVPFKCDEATVFINITPENDEPKAIDDIIITTVNQPAMGELIGNDFDIEGDELIINTMPIEEPTNGTVNINPDGTYTYTPNPEYSGEDTFQYEICDDGTPQKCDTATTTIYIIKDNPNANDAPVAVNDNFVTNANQAVVNVNLLSNDFDPDRDNILINTTPIDQPTNGTVSINNDGIATYDPATDYIGEDEFTYQICDNANPSLCDIATVKITILSPSIFENSTYANDDVGLTFEDTPLLGVLTDNDNDPEGDNQILETMSPTPPMNGLLTINPDGSFEYMPDPGYSGSDLFTYIIMDDGMPVVSDTATVYLTVLPVQDPPIAKNDINLTLINTPINGQVLTNDSDPDGDNLIVNTTPFTTPQNGILILNQNGTYEYTPNFNFLGEDNFDYILCHDQLPTLCDTARVTIKVINNTDSINNPPVGVPDNNSGQINTPVSGNLLANDSDPDGNPIIINTTPINDPTNGALVIKANGTFTYTPNPDFVGEDMFHYEVCDIENMPACDTVKVSIEIFPNQGNTVVANDDAITGEEDKVILGALLTNDFDPQGDNLIINTFPTSLPKHGTVVINSDGTFSYSPTKDYHGPDQFIYEVCDDNVPSACAMATAYLMVLPINDTLCNISLPTPTLLSNDEVCFTEDIYLFIQENYPLFSIENTDLNFEFIWYNSLGAIIATNDEPNLTIAANNPNALPPFTVKVNLDECSSDFAAPIDIDIVNISNIAATNSSGNKGICANESVQLFVTSVENSKYEWTVVGQATIFSTEQNPVIASLATTTTYEVKVIPELCDTFATTQVTVQINNAPTVNPQQANNNNICVGSSFQLMSNVTGTAPFTFEWTGPANFTSIAENPVISNVQLDNVGSYTIKVTDANGCFTSGEIAIDNILEGIDRPLLNSNSPICIDGTIEINLQTPYSGSNITYNWINGQGEIVSTNRNLNLPSNDVAAINPFILQVTVDGCQSPNSDFMAIEIQDSPIASATATTREVCKGGEIQLNGNLVTGATYEWRILGSPAIISTLQNPVLKNIQQSADYTLTLSGGICSDKSSIDTIAITVNQPIDFTPNRNYTLNQNCSVANLALSANVEGNTNGLEFRWSGPNNYVTTEENPVIVGVTDAFNGSYTLEITNEKGCVTSKSIFVNEILGGIARPIISADKIGCESDNIVLSVPLYQGAGIIYNWFQDGGTLIGLNNTNKLLIDDAVPGTKYHVDIKIGGCLIQSDTLQPIIFGQPTVVIDETAATLCTDGSEEITLNATIEGGQAPYEIVWTSSNGFKSFKEDPVLINVDESLAGTYSIEITDKNGCFAKASTEIDIKDAPKKPIITVSSSVCEGEVITLTAPIYEGVGVTYNWKTPNNQNINGLNTNQLEITSADASLHQGEYTLEINVDGCISESEPITINLFEIPSIRPTADYNRRADCTSNNIELNANLSENVSGLNFEWTGPNGFTSNIENPIIINATTINNGQYALQITNSTGCQRFMTTNVIENITAALPKPIIQSSTAVCEGGLMVLSVPIYTATNVNYSWFLNSQLIDGANTNEITIGPLVENQDEYVAVINVGDCQLTSDPVTPTILAVADINPSFDLSQLCEGGTLQLSANVPQTVGNITYNWTGPSGYTSNAENPLINKTDERYNGTYTLTISTPTGCETSTSILVSGIIDQPKQPTVITNSPVCANNEIELSIQQTSQSDDYNYIWINGEGDTIGTERTLNILTTDSRAIAPYYAHVMAGNCGVVSSIPVMIDIISLPSILITNNGPLCAGEDVFLSATEVENANYLWTDAATGTIISIQQNPTIFAIDTTTTFNLMVFIDECRVSSTVSTTVRVKEKPTITQLTQSTSLCEGQELALNAVNGNPTDEQVAYTWTGPNDFIYTAESGDNMFPVSIPNFQASQAGTYKLTIGGEGNCSSESRSVVIGVSDALTTPTLSAASNLVCGGESILLTANSLNGTAVTYEWYTQTPDGDLFLIRQTSTPTMIISNASAANSKDYVVRIFQGGCTSGYSNTVQVTVLDINSNIVAENNSTEENGICEGGVIKLSTPFYEGATYTWFGPAGFTSDKPNPIITNATLLAAGDYFVVINIEGCSNLTSAPTTVYIKPQPNAPTIINSGIACIGETVTISVASTISVKENDTITYQWYNVFTNNLIRTTTVPNLILSNITEDQGGNYYLRLVLNGCQSEPSNETLVEVITPIGLNAFAGNNQILCAASEVQLNATPIQNGAGIWTSPTGASIENPTIANTKVTNLKTGINQFVWTISSGQCSAMASDTVEIVIGILTTDIAFAGIDQELCEVNSIKLQATELSTTTGIWTQSNDQAEQGVSITDPRNPTTTVDGIAPGNSYSFIWTISQVGCNNFSTDTVLFSINDMPPDNALIRDENIILCEEDQLQLIAEHPSFSEGMWINETDATIANPMNATTFVENLIPGTNTFIWALSNGACTNYSADTIVVHSDRMPIANADRYSLKLNDSITVNLFENDDLVPNVELDFIITKYPENGTLEELSDGTVKYVPKSNYFGCDDFRYKICSKLCESLCDTTTVYLMTGENSEGSPEGCLIPNVISPNSDGINDYFLVSCINEFPENQLKVFNRWGDEVYSVKKYQNDWAGTHKGSPLPSGTYFYILQLTESGEPLQGFITIFR